MASAKDIAVKQSPKTMSIGEAYAFNFDFSLVGTPEAVTDMTAYDSSGADVSSSVLSDVTAINGDVVTAKLFTPTSAEMYRLIVGVTITGNTAFSSLDVAVFDPEPSIPTAATFAYGSVTGVASLVPRHANRGRTFDDTTNPTITAVNNWLDQVSSVLNTMLSTEGFSTPITDTSITPSLDFFVNQEVAAMVAGANGSGRYGPSSRKKSPQSQWAVMSDAVRDFVSMNAIGLERAGATRDYSKASGIGFRQYDESGDEVVPIFQREAFGEDYEDWDV